MLGSHEHQSQRTLQLGGDGEEVSAHIVLCFSINVAFFVPELRHHLIRSSTQGGGKAISIRVASKPSYFVHLILLGVERIKH